MNPKTICLRSGGNCELDNVVVLSSHSDVARTNLFFLAWMKSEMECGLNQKDHQVKFNYFMKDQL